MPTYPSKKRYDEKNLVRVTVGFNRKTEPELVQRIEAEESRATFLKRLVREQVEREKKEGEK